VANNNLAKYGITGAVALAASILIIPFEGNRNTVYLDPPGVRTICFGHTGNVPDTANDEQCIKYLVKDLQRADAIIDRYVKVPLSDSRRASLLDFIYNIGEGAFSKSTLLKKINSGDNEVACAEMKKWVCSKATPGLGDANGRCKNKDKSSRKLEGLVRRREAEYQLCIGNAHALVN
jgi:lysozyme